MPLSPLIAEVKPRSREAGASKTPGLRSAISGRNHSFCRRLSERLATVRRIKCRLPANTNTNIVPVHKRQIVCLVGSCRSTLAKDPVSCALMSGLLRGVRRWPSWVFAYVSGTNLSGVLARGTRLLTVLPELLN
jgi:hypothetical protein